ncbi:MAG: methylmalonyl-CoA epimerase, partial [candidate division Zixibacteria bacterium]|nr:methylmalonyl-CoA epimerase [candidate division Zixibacteria bacterium]
MLKSIAHVAIAVGNLDRACDFYRDVFGARIVGRRLLPSQKVEIAFVQLDGDTKLELLSPTEPDSPVGRFLARHGPGLHHVCFEVEDIEKRLEYLADHGIRLIDALPRPGAENDRIAFLHPAS